jgi:hypothetical protein
MVRVVLISPPFILRVAGENVQLEAAGKPLHAKLTDEFKPFTGFTEMVKVADCPALMVALPGAAPSVKSPAGLPTINVVLVELGRRAASPEYSAEMV